MAVMRALQRPAAGLIRFVVRNSGNRMDPVFRLLRHLPRDGRSVVGVPGEAVGRMVDRF
jgi:hypothetical protein